MAKRLLVFVTAAVVVAVAAQFGLWFAPFVAGAAAGVLSRWWRGSVLAGAAGAVAGWGLPLWVLALRGFPSGATARAIAGFAGLPALAFVTVMVTLLLAFLQAVVGAWLARAFAPPRPASIPVVDDPPDLRVIRAGRAGFMGRWCRRAVPGLLPGCSRAAPGLLPGCFRGGEVRACPEIPG